MCVCIQSFIERLQTIVCIQNFIKRLQTIVCIQIKWPKLPFCMHTEVLLYYANNLITVCKKNAYKLHAHFGKGVDNSINKIFSNFLNVFRVDVIAWFYLTNAALSSFGKIKAGCFWVMLFRGSFVIPRITIVIHI